MMTPSVSVDVEFVTTLHGDEPVSFRRAHAAQGDQDRLLRAIDDVALGELDEAVHEGEEPEGSAAHRPAELALQHSCSRCATRQQPWARRRRPPLDKLKGAWSTR